MDVAEARVVDVGRNSGSAAGRAEDAGHKARLVLGFRSDGVTGFASQSCTFKVQFVGQCLHAIVRHADAIGIEGVGFQQIRARLQVSQVNGLDDLRLGQGQQVIITLQVARPVGKARPPIVPFGQLIGLDHGPHGAIQKQDAFGQQIPDQLGAGGVIVGHGRRGWMYATVGQKSGIVERLARAINSARAIL